jgi:hypothetical protein
MRKLIFLVFSGAGWLSAVNTRAQSTDYAIGLFEAFFFNTLEGRLGKMIWWVGRNKRENGGPKANGRGPRQAPKMLPRRSGVNCAMNTSSVIVHCR